MKCEPWETIIAFAMTGALVVAASALVLFIRDLRRSMKNDR